ncbi:MAG: hypothetical protein HQM14_20195 [SAR324 cluster bacterium]|nr:hypothetical protein [SAR324 cluster bacterium]
MNNYSMRYASEKLGLTSQALEVSIQKYEVPTKQVGAKVFLSERNIEFLKRKITKR